MHKKSLIKKVLPADRGDDGVVGVTVVPKSLSVPVVEMINVHYNVYSCSLTAYNSDANYCRLFFWLTAVELFKTIVITLR